MIHLEHLHYQIFLYQKFSIASFVLQGYHLIIASMQSSEINFNFHNVSNRVEHFYSIRSRMNSQSSLIEEPEHTGINVQHLYNTPRIVHPRLPHQETCESDAGVVEDIGSYIYCLL